MLEWTNHQPFSETVTLCMDISGGLFSSITCDWLIDTPPFSSGRSFIGSTRIL